RGADERAPRGDRADGLDDLRKSGVLQHVTFRAGLEGAVQHGGLAVHRQEHDSRALLPGELLGYAESAQDGQLHVEDDHVGQVAPDLLERDLSVGGLGHHAQVRLGLDDLPEPLPEDRMVVGDDDPDLLQGALASTSGASTTTVVPCPGVEWIRQVPLRSFARAERLRRPNPPSAGWPLGDGMSPRPLSETESSSPRGPRRSVTRASVACACLTMFDIVSWTIRYRLIPASGGSAPPRSSMSAVIALPHDSPTRASIALIASLDPTCSISYGWSARVIARISFKDCAAVSVMTSSCGRARSGESSDPEAMRAQLPMTRRFWPSPS